MLLGLASCDKSSSIYTVRNVSDGDTLTVLDTKGDTVKVRFACIDAPEVPHSEKEKRSRKAVDKSQFNWGNQAKARVQELVKSSGDRVKLLVVDTDRYKREVGEVRLTNGTLIQEVLVKEGLAIVYRPYINNCPSRQLIEAAEASAKKQKRGLWGDSKFVPPWDFRKK